MSDVVLSISDPIAAIGITNQRETAVVWDRETSLPLHRALVWQDRRTTSRCTELEDNGLASTIRESTGLIIDPYFSATKFEWIAKDLPVKNNAVFGTIDSWLIWKLTDGKVHATDTSNASRTMLFNINSLRWDNELLDLFGVNESSLPQVKASNGDFGRQEKKHPAVKEFQLEG